MLIHLAWYRKESAEWNQTCWNLATKSSAKVDGMDKATKLVQSLAYNAALLPLSLLHCRQHCASHYWPWTLTVINWIQLDDHGQAFWSLSASTVTSWNTRPSGLSSLSCWQWAFSQSFLTPPQVHICFGESSSWRHHDLTERLHS